MSSSLILSVISLSMGLRFANAYPAPAECRGACFSRDPSIIQASDGSYYRFSTGNGVKIAQASSLTGTWQELGAALPNGSEIPLNGYTGTSLWAPEVHKIGNTYYMYYAKSLIDTLDSVIGVATSPSLAVGSWTDQGSTGISSTESTPHNAIDPTLIQRADGTYQITFGSHVQDIWYVPVQPGMLRKAADAVGPISYNAAKSAQEGAFMYYHGGYYYLFVSAGSCCGFSQANHASNGNEYHITVCRSTSTTGGFVDQNGADCAKGGGTTILASHDNVYAPGGEGVYNDPTYGPIIYYMYYDTNVGFATNETVFGWNPLDFSSGWPVVAAAPSENGYHAHGAAVVPSTPSQNTPIAAVAPTTSSLSPLVDAAVSKTGRIFEA